MLNVNRKRLSRAVWETLFADLADLPWHVIENLEKLDPERQTGSTNHASLIALWAVVRYFRPQRVAEVGTYIGKSTYVLSRLGADVHTCDMTHDFKLPLATKITQYHSRSTDMLAKLDGKIDLLHLDGRLQPDDKPHLERLFTPDTVITLDDFEGIEKGVWNAMQIDLSQRILVYPPEERLTGRYVAGDATTAIILPSLRLTPQ